jgi:hypothetical protein
MKRKYTAGFTLLEALVVLIITSLVSVVLIQGFGLVLSARTSAQNKLVAVDEAVLEQNLFLEPLRGILPDFPEKPNVFGGDAQRLHGITTRPLQGRTGTPVRFSLSMDYNTGSNMTSLIYAEEGMPPLRLGSWEGGKGAFSYRDRSGPWTDVWPPPGSPDAVQTPWLIRIEKGSGFPENLVASISGPHQRRLRFMDTPMGASVTR